MEKHVHMEKSFCFFTLQLLSHEKASSCVKFKAIACGTVRAIIYSSVPY